MSNSEFHVNSDSIKPMVSRNCSQIILQRHCSYDRVNGSLNFESIDFQNMLVSSFINDLKNSTNLDELKNTYFLFDSSNTTSSGNFKRCVETTNIAMRLIKVFLEENRISSNHIINLNEESNYGNAVRENSHLTEPKMFTDSSGYLEYLKEKHNGINKDFWIDFEEDLSKEKRLELNSEGPNEIVDRAIKYISILQRYSKLFHAKFPNSRLIIWCGTHYDLISPLVKQKILGYDKSDIVNVDYCGGISLVIDEFGNLSVSLNGVSYPFDFQYNEQPPRHF